MHTVWNPFYGFTYLDPCLNVNKQFLLWKNIKKKMNNDEFCGGEQ